MVCLLGHREHREKKMLAHPSRPTDPTHAQYDGKQLKRTCDGLVIDLYNERRRLITHVVVLAGVTTIHPEAFWGCTFLSSVTLPEGLTTIGECAFSQCSSLSSISLPEGLAEIGWGAFFGCTSLSSILLPEGLTTLGKYAFEGCTSLTSVTLPEGLTTIDIYTFSGCTSLSCISIPDSVSRVYTTSLDESDDENDEDDDQNVSYGVAPTAFNGCTLLSQLSAAKSMDVEQFLRWRRRVPRQRYAVVASLARLRDELYARQAKRARLDYDDAAKEDEEEEEEEEVLEEQAGVLRGTLAFDIIHSDDLWRHILEFL